MKYEEQRRRDEVRGAEEEMKEEMKEEEWEEEMGGRWGGNPQIYQAFLIIKYRWLYTYKQIKKYKNVYIYIYTYIVDVVDMYV